MAEKFTDAVNRMSGGQIEIAVFPVGELIESKDLVRAVNSGTIDMAFGLAYHSGDIDIDDLEFGLPFAWQSLEEARVFWNDYGFIDLVREAYAEKGLYFISPLFYDPIALLTKEPYYTFEELKGAKLKASAGFAECLNKMGISTVFVPYAEMYLALATGTIDGVLVGSMGAYQASSLHEVAKYYYKPDVLKPGVCALYMNMDLWNSLPDNLKAIIEVGASEYWSAINTYFEKQAYQAISETGVEVITLPPEEVAKMRGAALSYWDDIAAKSPRTAKAVNMLKEWNKLMGRIQ